MKNQKVITKTYLIKDIDCEIIVEETTRKEILGYLEQYLENLKNDWFDASNESFTFLYKDGTIDCINIDYDGHKIKKQNISSSAYFER